MQKSMQLHVFLHAKKLFGMQKMKLLAKNIDLHAKNRNCRLFCMQNNVLHAKKHCFNGAV